MFPDDNSKRSAKQSYDTVPHLQSWGHGINCAIMLERHDGMT